MSLRWLAVLALGACAQATAGPDAAPIDAVAIDAMVDAPPPPQDGPGGIDSCAGAQDLTAIASGTGGATVSGNLTGFANDVQPPQACTGFVNDGPDAVYQVTVGGGQRVTATLTPQGWDGAIELVQPCVMTPICLAGADTGGPDVATYVAAAPTTVYIVVDSFDVSAFGAYTLNVTIQ